MNHNDYIEEDQWLEDFLDILDIFPYDTINYSKVFRFPSYHFSTLLENS